MRGIIVDTSGGDVTISLGSVGTFERPLTIKNVGGGIGNSAIIEPDGAETIGGDSTYPEISKYFSEQYEKRQDEIRLKTEKIMAEFNKAVDEHLSTVKLMSRCLQTRRQPDLTSPL